jgi:hypothetical protein
MKLITKNYFIIYLFFILVIILGYYFIFQAKNNKTKISIKNINFIQEGSLKNSDLRLNFNIEIAGGLYDSKERVVLIPIFKKVNWKNLYIYYDIEFPYLGTGSISYRGLADHLNYSLPFHQIENLLSQLIDADELKKLLTENTQNDSDNADQILILPAGVLPDKIYSKVLGWDLVKNWIAKGGTVFWLGDYPGYYLGESQKEDQKIISLKRFGVDSLIDSKYFFNQNVPRSARGRTAVSDSKISQALNLEYNLTDTGVLVNFLNDRKKNYFGESIDQTVLGKIYVAEKTDRNRTSIGLIPFGKGRFIFFGSGIKNKEAVVADDIAKILSSDIISTAGVENIIWYDYDKVAGQDLLKNITDIFVPKGAVGVNVISYSKDPWNNYFVKKYLPIEE